MPLSLLAGVNPEVSVHALTPAIVALRSLLFLNDGRFDELDSEEPTVGYRPKRTVSQCQESTHCGRDSNRGEPPLQVQTLSGTLRSQLGPLAIFLLLVARLLWRTGFSVDHSPDVEAYIEAILAALVLVFTCLNLLSPPTLILDDRGFTWRSWRTSGTFPWASTD